MSSTFTASPAIKELIDVEMGEIKVSSCLTDTLMGYGLGACVGVCVYDPTLKVAGFAHIVLPNRQKIQASTNKPRPDERPGKFADTAIPFLVEEIARHGGAIGSLKAVIVGGAHIFSHDVVAGGTISRLEIGQRNITAIVEALGRYGIAIVAQDVGGCHGRTVHLRVCDGVVTVRPIGASETVLAVLGRAPSSKAPKSVAASAVPGAFIQPRSLQQ